MVKHVKPEAESMIHNSFLPKIHLIFKTQYLPVNVMDQLRFSFERAKGSRVTYLVKQNAIREGRIKEGKKGSA